MTGLVGWRAGSGGGSGLVAGLALWLAGWDGGPGGPKGMNLWIKECSGVNIVTENFRPLTKNIRLSVEKVNF